MKRYCPYCNEMTDSQTSRPEYNPTVSPCATDEACGLCWEKYPEFREGPYTWPVAEERHQMYKNPPIR